MDELLELLQDVRDDVDFETCETLIDDGILASFDILQIISSINEAFDVEIPATSIIPKNFNSMKAMYAMIQNLLED
ncbi:MAG: acyl carrier protein [Lachnospiraceae bacterium]|nr:acyl carrier protein [Lachnospiraceae bacterium]